MCKNHLSFTTNTKLFPIIGYPMAQSAAAFVYNPLFAGNNIDEIMWPIEIRREKLGEFVNAFFTLGLKHFALTMPYKAEIIPYLDRIDSVSKLFNSVNVVKIDDQGRTIGKGFDGIGNIVAIRNAGVNVNGMDIVILGAGSTVGVILLELAKEGANKVTLINRTAENAKKLIKKVNKQIDMTIDYLEWTNENLDSAAYSCDFLMQTTALGLKGYPADYDYLGFLDKVHPRAVIMENIINPPITKFAKKAKEKNLKLIYGVDMLLGQAEEIFKFCYGLSPSLESIKEASRSVYSFINFKK